MLDRFFRISEHQTTFRREVLAGLTTFLTMAYIIFVQPAILSGRSLNQVTGLDFGAVMTATCLAAALATGIMALYARLPIAQAPGMGENFFFVVSLLPAARDWIAHAKPGDLAAGTTTPWQIGLGVIFISAILFLLLSLLGVREVLLAAISPSMRNGIAVGIGLFIAFIGLENAGLIVADPGTGVRLTPRLASPDLVVFFFGLLVTAGLHARRIRGAMLWGILASTLLALVLLHTLWRPGPADAVPKPGAAASRLTTDFAPAERNVLTHGPVSLPPSLRPTFLRMDLRHALNWSMAPFILMFLFMNLFDTLGTLIGVSQQAGLVVDNRIPRLRQALVSDAVGTAAGAALGTSTVVSFIESAAGVAQGGRTGLTALVVALLFLAALPLGPLAALIGSYPPITAPALVVIGSMMMQGVTRLDWSNGAEAIPAFLIVIGIPLSYSIADGLALGFIAYPIVKLLAGQGRDVKWPMYVVAVVLAAYFILVRSAAS
jgi:AGZA family xanthine/uracil permease-like MFS transporter